jgi:serine/threonine-protein kinase HipA
VHIATLASARAALAAAKAAEAAMHAASGDPAGAAMAARAAADAAAAAASVQALSEFSETTATYRVHQEDICQALSVPGPKEIVDLLRAHSAGAQRSRERNSQTAYDEDAATFLDALILNWLIGGTDAHAKNYSILIGGEGLVRLAPLYDLAQHFRLCQHRSGQGEIDDEDWRRIQIAKYRHIGMAQTGD